MTDVVVKTSNDEKDDLDLQVARSFYATNIPFNVSEHSEFKKLMRHDYATTCLSTTDQFWFWRKMVLFFLQKGSQILLPSIILKNKIQKFWSE